MMNENENHFDVMDSLLRVGGIIGFLAAILTGFVLTGGMLHWLVHPPEMLVVLGTVFFGLLCTHRTRFIAYLPEACKACFRKPNSNFDFCQISDNGRKFAAVGGGMAVVLSLISTMSTLDNPEQVGRLVAAAMSGVFLAMLLSQGIFVFLRASFSENESRSETLK